jgi:rod shape-determining protein MreC
MEVILNRYRNVTVLLAAVALQLALLGYQVKGDGEVRLIRVWAVSAVTPLARVIETGRSGIAHFFRDYFLLLNAREENERLKKELDRVSLDNQYLRAELATAERAKALAIFQQQSQSKTIAAKVIGNATGAGSKVVILDRGSASGVMKGMAVITPDGIVGKITSVFPTASFVLLITDPAFAAGVVSQQNRVHGTVKGQGTTAVMVDYIQNEQKVDQDEWFYTSGDDRIFPKGLPVGKVTSVRPGKLRKEVIVAPSGMQNGLEEVLIIIEGAHAEIPEAPAPAQPVHLQEPPPAETSELAPAPAGAPETDADRLVERYRRIGEAEKHVYGASGGRAPNYNAHFGAQSVVVPPDAPLHATGQGSPGQTALPQSSASGPARPAPTATPATPATSPASSPATSGNGTNNRR